MINLLAMFFDELSAKWHLSGLSLARGFHNHLDLVRWHNVWVFSVLPTSTVAIRSTVFKTTCQKSKIILLFIVPSCGMWKENCQKSCEQRNRQRSDEAPLDACDGFSKDWVGGSTWQNKKTHQNLLQEITQHQFKKFGAILQYQPVWRCLEGQEF